MAAAPGKLQGFPFPAPPDMEHKMAKRKAPRALTPEDWKNIHAATKKILRSGEILKHERQDIEQELAVILWKESRKFRSRQSSWASFSYLVIDKHLSKIIRDRTQPSARYRNFQAVSLNISIPDSEDNSLSSELIEQVNSEGLLEDGTSLNESEKILLKMDIKEFMDGLPLDLKRICELLKSMRLRDVSRTLRISPTTLYKRIEKIKRGMIACGLGSCFEAKMDTFSKSR